MGRKNKLQKFADILSFPNVYECYKMEEAQLVGIGLQPVDLNGRWLADHFHNNAPITLELACGAGEYTVGLGIAWPNRNFIGVDVKGNRLWTGAKAALDGGHHNVAFLRTRIEIIHQFFGTAEVDEIWITFADPFPKHGKDNRRLTSPFFNKLYRQILRPGGLVHLKHDDPGFYQFTLDTIAADPDCTLLYANEDIYASPLAYPELELKTKYEQMHLEKGKSIKYIRYQIH